MGQLLKDSGMIINNCATLEHSRGLMEISTMASGKTKNLMVKESTLGKMAVFLKVNFKMIRCMDTVSKSIQMAAAMRATMSKANTMAMANTRGVMDPNMKATSNKETLKVMASISLAMDQFMKVIMKMD